MTVRTESFRRFVAVALWAGIGLVSTARAGDASEQRLALACARAADCAAQPAAAPRQTAAKPHADAVVAKKPQRARPAAPAVVDYERDLWRHQSAS